MENNFYKNKVVLITGSSMGIGKEIALQVLQQGGKVILTGRNAERLEAAKNDFSNWKENVLCFQGDVSNHKSNIELVEKTIEKFGRLDVLINNAGLSCFGAVDQMDADVAKQIIDTNIYGSLYPVMAALPELKKSKGTILFISSIAGFHGLPGYSAYSLSKMSLKALAQSLSVELKSSGVSVCISYVGFTENESDKKTLAPNGDLVKVPSRNKQLTVTRTSTANKILTQIENKKYSQTHSLVGGVTDVMSRMFPYLTTTLLSFNYKAA